MTPLLEDCPLPGDVGTGNPAQGFSTSFENKVVKGQLDAAFFGGTFSEVLVKRGAEFKQRCGVNLGFEVEVWNLAFGLDETTCDRSTS